MGGQAESGRAGQPRECQKRRRRGSAWTSFRYCSWRPGTGDPGMAKGGGGGRRPSRLQSITQSSTGQDHSQEGFSESENVEPVCHIPVSFESCCCLLSHSSPYLLSLLLLILTSPSLASSLCSFNCCSYQLVHPSLTTFSLLSQALHVTSASVSLFATLIHSIHLVTIFTNTLNNS